MDFQAIKGFRDFYPEDMRLRNWLCEAWRRVSLRNGFVEYDGPEMEYLDLYRVKSGDEIVSQLFSLVDRGGRELALRPEITPTLARMINARVNALPRPIKWFSIPRLFRAENPQRGRLREFFQWNIDIVGPDEPLADAECVFTAVDLLQEVGLTPADAVVRYSSRGLLSAVLAGFDVAGEAVGPVLAALDKRAKVPPEAFEEMFAKALPAEAARAGVRKLLEMPDAAGRAAPDVAAALGLAESPALAAAMENLRQFEQALQAFGIADWCRYDTGIVRGLAYYTGIVYEIYDRPGKLRALAGGGRYDNLLEVLGGPRLGATGFGMGDAVLSILLADLGKLPDLAERLDCFAVMGQGAGIGELLAAVAAVRRAGVSCDFSTKPNTGKALKDADRRNARVALIVKSDVVSVKDLKTATQTDVPAAQFLAEPGKYVAPA